MCNKIDRLGRIVIPIKLRKKFNLTEGVEVEFSETYNGISISATTRLCKICRCEIDCIDDIPLCEDCISKIRNRQR